jgi:hypothetical protein
VNGNLSCNGQKITETLNKYFVWVAQNNHNIYATPNRDNPISFLSRTFKQPFPTINLKCVSSKEIEDIAKSLKIKNSHGYDGISTTISRFSIPCISSLLTYICNRMLTTGRFPARLKLSEIRPIFKRGDKKDISNYRLISLLTLFSKIFEKVIYNRFYCHIKDNYILANEQFGFRRVFIVKTYWTSGSYQTVQREFCKKFGAEQDHQVRNTSFGAHAGNDENTADGTWRCAPPYLRGHSAGRATSSSGLA